MTLEQYKSLNDDEIAMLWYIVNKMERPVIAGIELDPELFTSIDDRALVSRVVKAEELVKEEAKVIYDSLKSKLGV